MRQWRRWVSELSLHCYAELFLHGFDSAFTAFRRSTRTTAFQLTSLPCLHPFQQRCWLPLVLLGTGGSEVNAETRTPAHPVMPSWLQGLAGPLLSFGLTTP